MSFLRKYATGAGADIYIPIVKRAVVDFAVGADFTPVAGDVKISIDGAAAANIGTLPVVLAMGNGAAWKFVFTNAELTGKYITVTVVDAATKAVEDQAFTIETYGNASALHPFDLGTASTAQTGDNFARLGAPVGASISVDVAAVKTETASIQADTDNIQTRLPAALVSGRMDSNAAVVGDKTGYTLTAGEYAALVNLIWDELTAEARTAGSFGQLVKDDINATISSRAIPGDLMGLVADAITSAKIATDAFGALELSADAANEIRDAVMAKVIEAQGSITMQQAMSIVLAVLAGVTATTGSTIKTPDGVATRVAATLNASNERTAMTLTPSA